MTDYQALSAQLREHCYSNRLMIEAADAIDELSAQYQALRAQYEGLQNDTKRYQWLREYMVSTRTDLDDYIVTACSNDKLEELDAAIDAIISAAALERMTEEAQAMGLYDLPSATSSGE